MPTTRAHRFCEIQPTTSAASTFSSQTSHVD